MALIVILPNPGYLPKRGQEGRRINNPLADRYLAEMGLLGRPLSIELHTDCTHFGLPIREGWNPNT